MKRAAYIRVVQWEPMRQSAPAPGFGLHWQSFLLFVLLIEAKLPAIFADALCIWAIAYFTIALRRVYGGTWAESLGRGTAILILYLVIFFVANLLLMFGLLTL